MEIKLTKDQYAQLMRLVYLGNWVVNGFHSEDIDEESDASRTTSTARPATSGWKRPPITTRTRTPGIPKILTEDEWLADLDEYKNDVFWDELEYRLADRDLVTRYGERAVDGMSSDDRQDEERKLVDQLLRGVPEERPQKPRSDAAELADRRLRGRPAPIIKIIGRNPPARSPLSVLSDEAVVDPEADDRQHADAGDDEPHRARYSPAARPSAGRRCSVRTSCPRFPPPTMVARASGRLA